jgi:periplasmic protein TonB
LEQDLTPTGDVYSTREIARVAGVRTAEVRRLVASQRIRTIPGHGGYCTLADAVAAVRLLADPISAPIHELFGSPVGARRKTGVPLIVSSAIHATAVAAAVLVTATGLRSTPATIERIDEKANMRMVFLAIPGPGGGGGGGGRLQKTPPPRAERKGRAVLSSPMPRREPPKRIVALEETRVPPKPAALPPEPLPAVHAPIATSPADVRDRSGVLDDVRSQTESRGPGQGGGVGSGTGTGLGQGDGSGVGPGSGGGTGGGPYRPGSGIQPPRLLQEVRPDYTDEARRRGIEGDVELEIVVRSNGTVGDVRVLRGLGGGLDQRAVAAVRQWRFAPARRLNSPVDVIVEVAVEFKLR